MQVKTIIELLDNSKVIVDDVILTVVEANKIREIVEKAKDRYLNRNDCDKCKKECKEVKG